MYTYNNCSLDFFYLKCKQKKKVQSPTLFATFYNQNTFPPSLYFPNLPPKKKFTSRTWIVPRETCSLSQVSSQTSTYPRGGWNPSARRGDWTKRSIHRLRRARKSPRASLGTRVFPIGQRERERARQFARGEDTVSLQLAANWQRLRRREQTGWPGGISARGSACRRASRRENATERKHVESVYQYWRRLPKCWTVRALSALLDTLFMRDKVFHGSSARARLHTSNSVEMVCLPRDE